MKSRTEGGGGGGANTGKRRGSLGALFPKINSFLGHPFQSNHPQVHPILVEEYPQNQPQPEQQQQHLAPPKSPSQPIPVPSTPEPAVYNLAASSTSNLKGVKRGQDKDRGVSLSSSLESHYNAIISNTTNTTLESSYTSKITNVSNKGTTRSNKNSKSNNNRTAIYDSTSSNDRFPIFFLCFLFSPKNVRAAIPWDRKIYGLNFKTKTNSPLQQ